MALTADRYGTRLVAETSPASSALIDAIAEAEDPDEVAAWGRRLPSSAAEIARDGGVRSDQLRRLVSGATDAMTRRLIDLATERLGPPPTAWAWIALGSAARREQGIVTDQDHAIAFEPAGRSVEELDGYFRRLAEAVTAGLEGAGMPRCRAGVVAANPALRRPVSHWVEAFDGWMAHRDVRAVRQTTILFDHRRVAGSLTVEATLGETIRTSPHLTAFVGSLERMARDAAPHRRMGIPRRFDVKHDGLLQVVNLARIVSVSAGIAETGTVERLARASALGAVDPELARRLGEAFDTLWSLRLADQLCGWVEGRIPTETIAIRGRRDRARLAGAVRAIRDGRRALLRAPAASAKMRGGGGSAVLEPVVS